MTVSAPAVRRLLEAALGAQGIETSAERIEHVLPLATSLLTDGERMVELAAGAGEPRLILRLREREGEPPAHADT